MSPLVGRRTLLEGVRRALAEGRAVALHGPTGIGKSALLDELESSASDAGTTVLRVGGAVSEQRLTWAALQDLWDQTPAELVAELPVAFAGLGGAGLQLVEQGALADAGGSVEGDRAALGQGAAYSLEEGATTDQRGHLGEATGGRRAPAPRLGTARGLRSATG